MPVSSQLDTMQEFMRRVLAEIGPRESAGEGERRLGEWLLREWRPVVDRVWREPFTCHPRAFLGSLSLSVACYFLAAICYWAGWPWVGLPFAVICPLPALLEVGGYREFVDGLFPERESSNVLGTILPRGAVRQRLIVSAHMDSAFEFRLWRWLGNRAAWVMALGVFGTLLVPVAITATLGQELFGWQLGWLSSGFGWGLALVSPFVGVFLFFHDGRAVPGAMDDLAGISVLVALGRLLRAARRDGSFQPENTEVVLLATGCEEAGLRGAKRFVRRHSAELKRIPTFGLFLDGICDERRIGVVRAEYCTGARHHAGLVRLACEVGRLRGWPIHRQAIPIGGTDAAAFSRMGVPACTLVGMDCHSLVDNYHTRLDTLERVRPVALARTLQIVVDMLERLDRQVHSDWSIPALEKSQAAPSSHAA